MSYRALLAVSVSCFFGASSLSAEEQRVLNFGFGKNATPLTAPFAFTGHSFHFGAETDAGDEFDWQRTRIRTPFAPPLQLANGNVIILPLLNYDFYQIDDPALLATDSDQLHRISVPINAFYAPRGSDWGAFATVTPQLNSDFESITSDDFDLEGRIGLLYRWSDSVILNLGIGQTRRLGEERTLPFVGINWTPNEDFDISVRGGALTASYRLSSTLIFRAGAEIGGNTWNVEERGTGQSINQGLSSINLGLGLDYQLRQGLWLSLWTGQSVGNELRVLDTGDTTLSTTDLDSAWYVYAGIKVFEW